MKNIVVTAIQKTAKQTTSLIFAIYNDTISKKTKPSLQMAHPIETTNFHCSHFECKTVWGHPLLAVLLSVGSLTFPYHCEHYQKESISKIDLVCQIANSLPTAIGPAYALCDSWFTCTKVIEAHFKKGYHFIGGLKTNRIIYPKGHEVFFEY